MATSKIAHVETITRSGPPTDWNGVATHKGQLYLNSLDGQYYKASEAGRGVEWTKIYFSDSFELGLSEDPDNPGFANITV